MSRSGLAIAQGISWIADWAFWVVMNRNHHPTLAIDMVATACLITGCAAAVYLHQKVVRPRFRGHKKAVSIAALLAVMVGSTVAAVFTIRFVYDVMWRPDPARYGLAFNLATDFLGVAVHVTIAALIVQIAARNYAA